MNPTTMIETPSPIPLTANLGDLVTEDPRRGRVLELFGLDYCCGGHRSLAEAAKAAGVDAHKVALALNLPDREEPPVWQSLGVGALASHIVETHHAYLWEEMRPLKDLVDKVHRVHGERHRELARVAEAYSLAVADLEPHLFKEERILFPGIAKAETGEIPGSQLSGPINQMLREHDYVGDLFEEMRKLTDGFSVPADGCNSYRLMMTRLEQMESDLHEHIHKENNVLFPRVLAEHP